MKDNSALKDKMLFDYLHGTRRFPSEYGNIDIVALKSGSQIEYYSYDLTFNDDIDASKEGNMGADEVQIIFNLNRDIKWYISKDNDKSNLAEVHMNKGEVCIYRNNDSKTAMKYSGGTSFKFKSLQMATDRFNELLKNFFNKSEADRLKKLVYDGPSKTIITPEMYRLLSEVDSIDRYREHKGFFLEGKLIELTAMVLYGVAYNKPEETEGLVNLSKEDSEGLEAIRESIQLKPYENYEAVKVAEKLSMSVTKLNRLFRRLYGTSLHAYVLDRRLEYSAKLLSEGEYNVTEVAVKSGFNNMSYFSRAFKAKYNVLPKRYSLQSAKTMSEKC